VTFVYTLFSPLVLRNFVPVIGGALFAYATTVTLAQALYDLPDSAESRVFLHRLRTGASKPVIVSQQHLARTRYTEPILRIGGPGQINIVDNEVVVTEVNGRFNRVLGPGIHILARFEYVRTALDLREQERKRDNVSFMTKEGIPLTSDVQVTFRLRRGNRAPTRANPFPFDEESVRLAAYGQVVREEDTGEWDQKPLETAIRQLQNKIGQLRLDELIDPQKHYVDPHPTIQQKVERDTRHILFTEGITLTNMRLGAMQLPPDVDQTVLAYWNTFSERPRPVKEPTDAEKEAARAAQKARIREQMIRSLAAGLAQVQEGGARQASSNEVDMAYRVVELLNRLLQEPEGREPLSAESIQEVQHVRNMMLKDGRVDQPLQLTERGSSDGEQGDDESLWGSEELE
jgi:hypothetical protein